MPAHKIPPCTNNWETCDECGAAPEEGCLYLDRDAEPAPRHAPLGMPEGHTTYARAPATVLPESASFHPRHWVPKFSDYGKPTGSSPGAHVVDPLFPGDRKEYPVFTGAVGYFPNAIAAVANCSKVANDQHNPGEPMHWAFEKSVGEGDQLLRHLMQSGTFDTDGIRHSAKLAWRALELLEREILAARSS